MITEPRRFDKNASRNTRARELHGGDRSLVRHESIETTHIYVEADLAIKERALERIAPANCSVRRFKADDTLLAFLDSL
jgi:integrase/recombinase XerD